jgi:acyl-CoA reductase-like NAD-dependent aldehyde dehydrogenase
MRGQPLIDDSQPEKVSKLVEDAWGKGAKALVGAEKTEGVAAICTGLQIPQF